MLLSKAAFKLRAVSCLNKLKYFHNMLPAFFRAVLLFLILIIFASCRLSESHEPVTIHVGMWSEPDFNELNEGMRYGKGHTVSTIGVFSNEEFGRLEFYFQDNKPVTFTRGAIVFQNVDGVVEINGDIRKDLVVIVFRKLEDEEFEIVKLDRLLQGKVSKTIRVGAED